jgi:hypothetical protein
VRARYPNQLDYAEVPAETRGANTNGQQQKQRTSGKSNTRNMPATGKRVPTGTRTRNLLLRRQAPYPLGHRDQPLGSDPQPGLSYSLSYRDQPLGSDPLLPNLAMVSLHKNKQNTRLTAPRPNSHKIAASIPASGAYACTHVVMPGTLRLRA